jgi:hypothetical protein
MVMPTVHPSARVRVASKSMAGVMCFRVSTHIVSAMASQKANF